MHKSQNDSPEWRLFEQLVARIEKDASAYGLKVTSPDYIKCKITGRLREVDASIRPAAKTSALLITIECRNRKRKEDVTWIEQLATKRKNIGAARTIAVSTTGFSKDASKVASKSRIDLRSLSDLSIDEINQLIALEFVLFTHKRCSLVSVAIRKFRSLKWTLPRSEDVDFYLPTGIATDEKIFRNVQEGHRFSLNDLWLQWQEVNDPFCGFEKGAAPAVQTTCFPFPGNVTIDILDKCIMLGDILLSVALSLDLEKVDLVDARRVGYKGDGINLQRIEFSSYVNEDFKISLQTDKDGNTPEDVRVCLDQPVKD